MLPLSGAAPSPAMTGGGAPNASARLACTAHLPASTPRAHAARALPYATAAQAPLSSPVITALSAGAPIQPRHTQQSLGAAVGASPRNTQQQQHVSDPAMLPLPGLLHARLAALACVGSSLSGSSLAAPRASSTSAAATAVCIRLGEHAREASTAEGPGLGLGLGLEDESCLGLRWAANTAQLDTAPASASPSPAAAAAAQQFGSVHAGRRWSSFGSRLGRAPAPTRCYAPLPGRSSAAAAAVGAAVGPLARGAASSPACAAAAPSPLTSSSSSPSSASCWTAAAAPALTGRHRLLSTGRRAHVAVSASGPDSTSPASPTAASAKASRKQKQQPKQPQPAQPGGAGKASAAAPQPPPPPQPSSFTYSPLHYNIEDFAARIVPTDGEKRCRGEVIEAVRAGVRKVWPNARSVELHVFGSFANGLSTWNSDLDLVVTGVSAPDRLTGGYEINDRARIAARLRKINDALHRNRDVAIVKSQLIPRARMPILKLWTRNRVCVDVSVGDDSGPRAARYMVQQCRAYPPLKPLVLVLKTYLKFARLNEVNTGGLSSYSLTNMVIAHLQEELKAGHDISDLGETLYTFLLRYGEEHDYGNLAVSVASGGIVPKMSLGFAMESARQAAVSMGSYDGAVGWSERLCVDCPLTGRDVSNGTYRIDLVRDAFLEAARKLEALARGRRITDTSLNYLQALFDVGRVLKRTAEPVDAGAYQDDYVKVIPNRIGAATDDEGEGEELFLADVTSEGLEGDDDDLDDGGDFLERQPAGSSAKGGQQRR